jgi:vacuolar protein sorting-associated protein 13A/C
LCVTLVARTGNGLSGESPASADASHAALAAAANKAWPYLGARATQRELVLRLSEHTLWRLAALSARYAAPAPPSAAAAASAPLHVSLLSLPRLALRLSFRTASANASPPPAAQAQLAALGLSGALANVDEAVLELQPVRLEGVHVRGEASLWRLLGQTASRQLRSQVLRLLQGVAGAAGGNVSSALGAASAGVAALSLDPVFQSRRRGAQAEAELRPRVSSVSDGLRDGGEALARSLLRGVSGLLTKPVEGARREGVEGFLKGVGKGLLGAAVVPMSGVLDLVSSTTQGLSASWDSVAGLLADAEQPQRRRLPRCVRSDGLLQPFDTLSARGQHVLRLASQASHSALGIELFRARGAARSDAYEAHVENLPGRRIAMLTNRRLLLLQLPDEEHDLLVDACTAAWQAEWRDVLALELHAVKGEPAGAPPSAVLVHLKRTARGFDSPEAARQLRRLIRCAPASRQASQLFELLSAVRGRALQPGLGEAAGGSLSRAASFEETDERDRDADSDGGSSDGRGFDLERLALGDGRPGGGSDGEEDAETQTVARAAQASLARPFPADSPPAHCDGQPAPPALPCDGFARIWTSRGGDEDGDGSFRPVSLWRPLPPPGFVSVGDVAQTGYEPPGSFVACYSLRDPALAPPLSFELVWRDSGSGARSPVTIWMPIPPPGFVALGCVAVAGDDQPVRGEVRCVALARSYETDVFDEATWRDAGRPGGWRCSMWSVDNDASTFLCQRSHERPEGGAARGALLY